MLIFYQGKLKTHPVKSVLRRSFKFVIKATPGEGIVLYAKIGGKQYASPS